MDGARLIRYRLALGEHFRIDARMSERILIDDEEVVDLGVAFGLHCEVIEAEPDAVWISGVLRDPEVTGRVAGPAPLDLGSLAGVEVRVRKGLDGSILAAENGDALERFLGGLSVSNVLRWLGASFAPHPVSPGQRWEALDRWVLSAADSPLAVSLPLRPALDVRYGFELERWSGRDGHPSAEIGVSMSFSGRAVSEELGVQMGVEGEGSGRIEVDLEEGKLTTSTRQAAIHFVPSSSQDATRLPSLSLVRRCEAGVRGSLMR